MLPRSLKICWSGLKDETSMNTMGKAKNSARTMRRSTPGARRSPVPRVGFDAVAMSVLLPGEEALDEGDGQHDDEEHQRDGGRVCRLLLVVSGMHRLVDHGAGGVHRAALRHDVHLGE